MWSSTASSQCSHCGSLLCISRENTQATWGRRLDLRGMQIQPGSVATSKRHALSIPTRKTDRPRSGSELVRIERASVVHDVTLQPALWFFADIHCAVGRFPEQEILRLDQGFAVLFQSVHCPAIFLGVLPVVQEKAQQFIALHWWLQPTRCILETMMLERGGAYTRRSANVTSCIGSLNRRAYGSVESGQGSTRSGIPIIRRRSGARSCSRNCAVSIR